jgi:hydroxypyruvate reductase
LEVLESGRGETDKPGDPRLGGNDTRMVATPQMALEAASRVALEAGIPVHILGDNLEGEPRDVAKVMAGIALQVAMRSQPFQPPCILLSGGETTVTVRGKGRGGRNAEFLLSLGIALESRPGFYAIAGHTDGVDGQEEIAGAYVAPESLARAWAKGIKPKDSLDNNDGHGFFEALGDSVVTGPTLTNVNDFRAILITDEARGQPSRAAERHAPQSRRQDLRDAEPNFAQISRMEGRSCCSDACSCSQAPWYHCLPRYHPSRISWKILSSQA